jgi:alpha-glucoside transport system permease protein
MTTTGTPPPPPAPAGTTTAPEVREGRRLRRAAVPGQANWLVKAVILLMCVLWIVPAIGLLITSFREPDAVNETGWWTVFANPLDFTQWTLQNYQQAWTQSRMGPAFINSFVVALPSTIIPIMIAAFAAYAFTFLEFPGRDWLFVFIVGLLVIPNQVALVPLLQLYGNIGLTGTFPAVWLAHAGFGMPLAIFILRNYMATLPKAIVESAKVDGASHFAIFWRLIVPMSVPALAAFAIFQFLWVWNDLLVALLFLGQGDNQVLTVALAGLLGGQGQGWQLLTAGGIITIIVPLIVFISLQRFFVRGLTAGAVKG